MTDRPRSAELHSGPGFRICRQVSRPDDDIITQFQAFDTGDLSDLLNRLYAMSSAIQNLTNDAKLVGPATTVRLYPGDNLMVHKALDLAQPGDVMVIDTLGNFSTAVVGEMVANKARNRGVAGLVIDGLVRDLSAMQEVGLAVFARGATPVGPLHRGPGEVNFPICCGGVVVQPGDLIVGDTTGVVVIPREECEDLLQRAIEQREALRQYIIDVKGGLTNNDWVDAILDANGCLGLED